jgi:hypothetical protein
MVIPTIVVESRAIRWARSRLVGSYGHSPVTSKPEVNCCDQAWLLKNSFA